MLTHSRAQEASPVALPAWLTPLRALGALMLGFVVVMIAGASFKYSRWGHGFDMVDFHLPIWGTLNGHFLLVSRYNFTDTFMGLDVALGFLPALPFYALLPSAYTLVVIQTVLLASAAIPVYLIAQRRFANAWVGVAFAAIYLIWPVTQFMTMAAPFQPRVPGLVLFFWAFYCLEQRRLLPYLLLLGLAMLTRTDAALVTVAFGMYAALRRFPITYALVPMLVGFVYFYVAITYITPQFYSASFQPVRVEVPFDLNRDYNDMWPCGMSPQACYYLHLGSGLTDIAKNILLHPVQVFFFIVEPPKLAYLALMFGSLLFLPLFAPRELLIVAPIFAINLLSNRVYQYVITEQYQILAVPGMIIAAIYGAAWLWERVQGRGSGERRAESGERRADGRRQTADGRRKTADGRRQTEDGGQQSAVSGQRSAVSSQRSAISGQRSAVSGRLSAIGYRLSAINTLPAIATLSVLLLVAALNIPLRNPVISSVRNPESAQRVALMEQLKAQIPPDARVAATSFLAPHLIPRLELYFIPGGPMHHQIDEAEYAFIDTRAAALRGTDIVANLLADPAWELLHAEDDLLLLRKRP
jgi:uncharacterized membrane protein